MPNIFKMGGLPEGKVKITSQSLLTAYAYGGGTKKTASGTIVESGLCDITLSSGGANQTNWCSLGSSGQQVYVTKGQPWSISCTAHDNSDHRCGYTLKIAYISYED